MIWNRCNMIIDTDIGSDVDDAMALIFALNSGLADVKAVTTVHGDTKLRARIAKRLCDYTGQDIPVAYGEKMPIRQKHIYWFGHEGNYILRKDRKENVQSGGVDLLVQTIIDNPGVEIAAIGPLTNIAMALQREPGIEDNISHIYIMGGAIAQDDHCHISYRAHNFKVDPEAVDIVMETGIQKTILTTETAKTVEITRDDLEGLRNTGKPELVYIARAALQGMKAVGYDVCYPYDPMVIGNMIMPELFEKRIYTDLSIVVGVNAKEFKVKLMDYLKGEK